MSLHLEREGAFAWLTIDRPAKRNAFDLAMWTALPGLVEDAMADLAVRVLVLRSAAPGVFSAGADIAEFGAGAQDPAWRAANQAAIRSAQLVLSRAPKPTLAQVEGDCVGGGCGLALACDLRIASPAARFGITPGRLGLVYSLHDTKLLVDLVGPAQAKRLLFTADLIGAAEAARIGMVDILAEDAAAEVLAQADRITACSPHSVAATKRIVRRILDGQADDDAETLEAFAAAFTGPDFAEGFAAFREKRKPQFR